MSCACRTLRAFYKLDGVTREAPGGEKLRCAQHVQQGRAQDKWVRAWLVKNYPTQRLLLTDARSVS